jgi:DNA polymerase
MDSPQVPAASQQPRSHPTDAREQSAGLLQDLAQACRQCRRCELANSRQQVVVGRGNPHARLLLIGEAPGAEEDASGQPFVGRAGKLLEQLLAAAGLDSERDLYIANVIKCRPPGNRKPSRTEIAACLPWLAQQIALQRPALIGLLGATALEALLGLKGGITKLRGQWLEPLQGSFLSIPQTFYSAQAPQQQPTPSSAIRPITQPPAPSSTQPITSPTTGPTTQSVTQSVTQSEMQSTSHATPRQQDQPRSIHQIGNLPNQSSNNPEAINRQTITIQPSNLQPIALMPLLHPSYLLRNPSGLEGSPKWHTLQDLRQLRRRLDELAAG